MRTVMGVFGVSETAVGEAQTTVTGGIYEGVAATETAEGVFGRSLTAAMAASSTAYLQAAAA